MGKVYFLSLCEIQLLKVTYMSCLGKAFESLTNKTQSFQRFKIFLAFLGFHSEL